MRPPPRLWVLEALTVPLEAAAFAAVAPFLRLLGPGDRHPVLTLPGLGADDVSLRPLRWALRRQGYWVHAWQLGRNLGPTAKVVEGLGARLDELHRRHGRTVSLVGQSLGGIYARELARRRPDAVRQVITLGSPYRLAEGARARRLTVPATSIYSRTDGVAPWRECIDAVTARAENVEVRGSHIGMGLNPAVLYAVLDRLGRPEGDGRPFVPPPALRAWYPRPADPEERVGGSGYGRST